MRVKFQILIVEDVPEMAELIQEVVEQDDELEVSGKAATVWEARRLKQRERPDLVLLDEVLPGESAWDFAQELFEEGIPVVLMTGMETPEHRLPSGAHGRISKPDWKSLKTEGELFLREIRAALPR
jgi:two-component system, CitB family, response regulator CitB